MVPTEGMGEGVKVGVQVSVGTGRVGEPVGKGVGLPVKSGVGETTGLVKGVGVKESAVAGGAGGVILGVIGDG